MELTFYLCDRVNVMRSIGICSAAMLTLSQIILGACASLPPSDPHIALDTIPKPLSGQRLEAGHLGEYLDIPVPGKVTVLDFWTSSCPPCLQAMPELERIWQRVDRDSVTIIGISEDETDADARQTLAEVVETPITFPMVFDSGEGWLQQVYQVGGIVPATYVVDKQGRVRFFFDGSPGDMARLEQAINALADE